MLEGKREINVDESKWIYREQKYAKSQERLDGLNIAESEWELV